jgi:putative transposase
MLFFMQTYALSTATYQRAALFVRKDLAELLVNKLFHYREQGKFQLHGFVVMPEHIHVLLSPATDLTIERCAQLVKGGFSHAAREFFKGEIWQTGFHEHRVRDAGDFSAQLQYIAENPHKRHLHDYKYVHTGYMEKLNPMPNWFCDKS